MHKRHKDPRATFKKEHANKDEEALHKTVVGSGVSAMALLEFIIDMVCFVIDEQVLEIPVQDQFKDFLKTLSNLNYVSLKLRSGFPRSSSPRQGLGEGLFFCMALCAAFCSPQWLLWNPNRTQFV